MSRARNRSAAGALLSVLSLVLSGCPFNVMSIKETPATFEAGAPAKAPFVLAREQAVTPSGGYSRTLRAGTKWTYVARIAQGDVYRTGDQVLTVEASNIQEAYIVVEPPAKMVGFYLPVEKTFSPAEEPAELATKPLE